MIKQKEVIQVYSVVEKGGGGDTTLMLVLPPATGDKILTQQIFMFDPLTAPKIWP